MIFHCMYIPRFVYPFICQWAFELLLPFDYYEYAAYEHRCASICLDSFTFLKSLDHTTVLHLIYFRNLQTLFVSFLWWDFPDSSAGKEYACNVGNVASIPGLGRSLGEGKGYPLQCSGLWNSMDCIVHGVAKSWTPLSNSQFRVVLNMHTDMQIKGRQFTLAWKHLFTLSIHLLRTCHMPDT